MTAQQHYIEQLECQVKALQKENEKLYRQANPEVIEVIIKPLDRYPLCNKPINNIDYGS